jgi:CMP/dCMP kinase
VFLYASPEERARRRAVQRREGEERTAAVLEDLRRRDRIDSSRETAPLKSADDAVVLNTDGNTFPQTVGEVVKLVRAAQRRVDGR